MSVTWVLESNVFSERCFETMLAHLQRQGLPHHVVRIVPFSHETLEPVPEVQGPCIVYGSLGVLRLAERQGWRPGHWTGETFTSTHYAKALGDLFLNSDHLICRLHEVAEVAGSQGWPEFFIKPNSDDKAFPGEVVEAGSIEAWVKSLTDADLLAENDVEVVLAPPRRLGREWRSVVVGGEVVASSLYRNHRRLWTEAGIVPEALAVVRDAAARFRPADVFVVDVGETDEGMKVIEYNTFNACGLYDCDVGAVIDGINDLVLARTDADSAGA